MGKCSMIIILIIAALPGCADTILCESPETGAKMSLHDARAIAAQECLDGRVTGESRCDAKAGQWRIGFDPISAHPGCDPECIVDITRLQAETDWRCIGVSPPEKESRPESCQAQTGERMTLEEAISIARENHRTEGTLKEEHACNDNTGTWWIGFDAVEDKDGCNPAIVVDVRTGSSEIKWRCLGTANPTT